jgi:hypothetical protein
MLAGTAHRQLVAEVDRSFRSHCAQSRYDHPRVSGDQHTEARASFKRCARSPMAPLWPALLRDA